MLKIPGSPPAPAPPASATIQRSAKPPPESASESPPGADRTTDDPLSQFLVYDSEAELIYVGDDEDEDLSQAGFRASLDPHKVAVPRSVLVMQGALLGLVALTGLMIGILMGRGLSGRTSDDDEPPQACLVTGMVALLDTNDGTVADVGAAVMIVPRDMRPERKVKIAGLRPQDPPPDPDHAGLQILYGLGGDYARTDAEGRFQLRVADRGHYFLLAISAHATQQDRDQSKPMLAQVGRFFELTPKMFEGHAVRWQEEHISRDREINVVFPRGG